MTACAAQNVEKAVNPSTSNPASGNEVAIPDEVVKKTLTTNPDSKNQSKQQHIDFVINAYSDNDLFDNGSVMFSEILAHRKPLIVNFWAGLCIPCRAEMVNLQEIHEDFGNEIILVGLDIGTFSGLGTKNDALELMEVAKTTYPVGSTDRLEVLAHFGVVGVPFTIFIKPDGSTLQTWIGFINRKSLLDNVNSLLIESRKK